MAYILAKKSTKQGRSRKLYYLVESYRKGKKIKRRTIYNLKEYGDLDKLLESAKQAKIGYDSKLVLLEEKLNEWLKDRNQSMFYYRKEIFIEKINKVKDGVSYCQKVQEVVEGLKKKYKM